MLNQCVVKEEQKHTQETTQKVDFLKSQKSYNSTILEFSQAVEKFSQALFKLLEAQYLQSQSNVPIYPFVFQCSYNEYLIHLGNNQILFKQTQDLKEYDQQQQLYYEQSPIIVPTSIPTIKLSVQKRQGFSQKDQKDSKNIPKNYCKAIISFAQKNQQLCLDILGDELQVAKFIEHLMIYKRRLLNIRVFSELLQQSDDPILEEFNRAFRIISSIFIKKFAINYIYNSKIVQHNWHIRYRQQILKGVKSPKSFSHIKKL